MARVGEPYNPIVIAYNNNIQTLQIQAIPLHLHILNFSRQSWIYFQSNNRSL